MVKTKTKTYSMTDIAEICEVSVASISALISKNSFKAVKIGEHNAKYYDSKVLEQIVNYYKSKTKTKTKSGKTTKDELISALRLQIDQQAKVINFLKEQINTKDAQIAIKDKQLAEKDKQLETNAKLADQAQKLDLTTHEQLKQLKLETKDTNQENSDVKTSHWWQWTKK